MKKVVCLWLLGRCYRLKATILVDASLGRTLRGSSFLNNGNKEVAIFLQGRRKAEVWCSTVSQLASWGGIHYSFHECSRHSSCSTVSRVSPLASFRSWHLTSKLIIGSVAPILRKSKIGLFHQNYYGERRTRECNQNDVRFISSCNRPTSTGRHCMQYLWLAYLFWAMSPLAI